MKRFFVSLTLLSLVLAGPALAQVPRTMSYQGVLTDNAGVLLPDGNYNLTFRIYDVAVAGAPLFVENHAVVPLVKGGFSVILGSINPIGLNFDAPYWLGVQVAADPEMTPRVALASAPYARALGLPFRIALSPTAPAIDGFATGFGPSMRYSNPGGTGHRIEPDVDGNGSGFFQVTSNGTLGFDGFMIDNDGAGNPTMHLLGNTSDVVMNMGLSGDASVALPSSAVSSTEMLNEPGIAQGYVHGTGVDVVTGVVMADIVTVQITTPASGYIVVEAGGQHAIDTNGSVSNYADLQIDETAGGALDNHYLVSGYVGSGGPTAIGYHPIAVRRTYFKGAGTYTFRLEARGTNSAGLTSYIWNPVITATYYPTAYGTVTAAPNLASSGDADSAAPSVSSAGIQRGGETRTVDLRELEIEALRAREAAAKAELALMKARVANDLNAKSR